MTPGPSLGARERFGEFVSASILRVALILADPTAQSADPLPPVGFQKPLEPHARNFGFSLPCGGVAR